MGSNCLALVCCVVCCGTTAAQSQQHFSPGVVIPRIVCDNNPQQSYALYLPSRYSTAKRWPIIYTFDPGARGQVAVEAIRAAAEEYGYIVVGSNNSRNGAESTSTQAASAMWRDTQQRFAIDENRRYFVGMSGGARMATALAISCNGCVAGVIANAAGFPLGKKPSNALTFAYFAAYGNADFNFLEFVDLRHALEASGMQFLIRVFEGQHGWAPPEVWQEALNWMDIQAMRAGSMQRDAIRVQHSYEAAIARANQFGSNKDFMAMFREYRFTARAFSGLTDTREAEQGAAALESDKRVKIGEKRELAMAAQQRAIMDEPSAQMEALGEGNLGAGDFMALRDSLSTLRKRIQNSRDDREAALVNRRALSGLVVRAFESGQFAVDQKRYDIAIHFFDLAISGSENPAWGHIQRARVYAITADKKHMLAELNQALSGGFHDVSVLRWPEFQPFQSDPDFQRTVQEWSSKTLP